MTIDKNELVKIALDSYRGTCQYSKDVSSNTMRQALIEANGGSTKIDIKAMRNNSGEIFTILEEIIPQVVIEGFRGDEFFMNLVEMRNLAIGDDNLFVIPDNSTFIVAEQANGLVSPRRQRIGESTSLSIATTIKSVRMYEELSRLLAGRVDWNTFIDKVSKAFMQKVYADIFAVLNGMTSSSTGTNATYVPAAGSYSEAALLTLIDHVESATGKPAIIVGTKPALRKVTLASVSDSAKEDLYSAGFYGKIAGTPMIAVLDRHNLGADTFMIGSTKLWVIASDDKPIKYITKGESYITDSAPGQNADLTQEYFYLEETGCGLIVNGKIGVMEISG